MTVTYDSIATTTLGSAAASITFSSIPGTFTDLRLVCVFTTADILPSFRFNSDTGSNYSTTQLYGNGTSAVSGRNTSATSLYNDTGTSSATVPGLIELDVFSYAGSTNKSSLIAVSTDKNGSGSTLRSVGLWRNTSAITSIIVRDFFGANLGAGTTATLYGIKSE